MRSVYLEMSGNCIRFRLDLRSIRKIKKLTEEKIHYEKNGSINQRNECDYNFIFIEP